MCNVCVYIMLVDLLTRENSEHVLHFESFKAYRTTFLLFANNRVNLIFVNSFLHRFLYLLVCLGRALVNGPPSFWQHLSLMKHMTIISVCTFKIKVLIVKVIILWVWKEQSSSNACMHTYTYPLSFYCIHVMASPQVVEHKPCKWE